MFNSNKVLAIIPAMDSLEVIPRKNARLLGNKPIIAHTIDTLKSSDYVDDIVVLTDDMNISRISELFGVSSLRCNLDESTSMEACIYRVMLQREKAAFDEYDIILILKPNAPLISKKSIDFVIEKFDNANLDSVISVKEDKNLRWGFDRENNRYFPLYSQRVSVDALPPQFCETGTIIATRRAFINEESNLGLNIDLVELSKKESMIIENFEDLWLAEKYLDKKRIVIVVNAFAEIGVGHVKRCLAIASKLILHEVIFVSNSNYPLGIEYIKNQNYPIATYRDPEKIFDVIDEINPDLVINDILDTSLDYVSKLRDRDYFVINFEDLGPGIEAANLVFNSLSDYGIDLPNIYTGYQYYILEDEFYFQSPKIISKDVKNILIMFLGNDQNNLTEKTLQALLSTGFSGNIDIMLGVCYPNKKDIISKYEIYSNVVIYEQVRSISELIVKSDIVFTSAGRTIYEVCSIGVPCICICQNQRELTNSFVNDKNGFINLGLADEVTTEDIINEFNFLVENAELRNSLNKQMLSFDLKNGFNNVWAIVKKNYADFEFEEF